MYDRKEIERNRKKVKEGKEGAGCLTQLRFLNDASPTRPRAQFFFLPGQNKKVENDSQ